MTIRPAVLATTATLFVIALSGCVTAPPPADGVAQPQQPDTCGAAALQARYIGQPGTEARIAQLVRESGAERHRVFRPGAMIGTTDFREDRLNITLDAAGNIERLRCG